MKKTNSLLLVIVLVLTVCGTAASADWVPMTSGTTNKLNDVWAADATHIFAVGDGGTILFCDGSTWSTMTSPTTNNLNAVYGTAANNVVAVGDSGTIVRYTSSWNTMTSGTTNKLTGITYYGNYVAAGYGGKIIKYNGASWTAMTSGTVTNIYDIGYNIAVTYQTSPSIAAKGLHNIYPDTFWSVIPMPPACNTNQLSGVCAFNVDQAFAVGNSGAILYTSNGTGWSCITSGTSNNLNDVWTSDGGSGNPAFAVGAAGTTLYFNGSAWSTMNSGVAENLNGVFGISSTNVVYAVGDNGTILQYTGCSYVDPSYGAAGTTMNVTITGTGTHFDQATSQVSFSNAAIHVNAITVTSATELIANITIAADTASGYSDVMVQTGTEQVKCSESFYVTIQLPKTGQTNCWDTNGIVISCTGTGQDGAIQAGVAWPSPRFTDNDDYTVTDNLTGLMWTQDANPAGDSMLWQPALDYVAGMNDGTYENFGYTDWRLPNMNELKSLVDFSQCYPVLPLDNFFTNVQFDRYWSSSTGVDYAILARFVDMGDGFVSNDDKSESNYYAWPVRGGPCGSICLPKTGQTTCWDSSGNVIPCTGTGQDGAIQAGVVWPSPRFTDNDDYTVTDNLTGLMWTKNAKPAGNSMVWQDALDYVKTLNTGGYTDWRLPNVNELESLFDYSQANPNLPQGNPFTNVQNLDLDKYWGSTTNANSTDSAWVINLQFGGVDPGINKSGNYYAWPVRGGSVGGSGTTTTTTTTVPTTTTTTGGGGGGGGYQFITAFGSYGSGNGQFYYPYGIVADSAGNIYVADGAGNRVQKFDNNGNYLTQWGSAGTGNGQFYQPVGIAVDIADNVYVTDFDNNRVQKFSAAGNYLTQWGSAGTGNGQFYYPTGIEVDSSGNVFVVDYYNNRVQKFDSANTYLSQWGSYGSGNGYFNEPVAIAVDSAGNVFVADTYNNRVQKFDNNGNYLTQWGSAGTGNGQFYYPYGVAVDSADNVFVADTYNNRVQKFDNNGNYLTQWGSAGTGNGQFYYPFDIAVDAAGNVFVSDLYNNRIQKFAPGSGTTTGPTTSTTAAFSTTTTSSSPIKTIYVSPWYGEQGQTLDVSITGVDTHFASGFLGSHVSFGCSSITVNSTTVNSATHLTANITIAPDARQDSCYVLVTTGSETAFADNIFQIETPDRYISYASPNYGYPGETKEVYITGYNTNFVNGVTQVSFGCSGITVNSTTVNSATHLTANITIAPDARQDSCYVLVTTGSETVSNNYAFYIEPQATALSSYPDYGYPGETEIVTITGDNTNFSNSSQVSFGCSAISVISQTYVSPTELQAKIAIASDAQEGDCFVLVETGAENAFSEYGFYIQSSVRGLSLSPDYGYPGETKEVYITGDNTNFAAGVTQVSFGCNAITVNAITVTSATQLMAKITIASDAQEGDWCYVLVKTGSESAFQEQAFNIYNTYYFIHTDPDYGYPGETKAVTIYGANTHFNTSTRVYFGNPGITINGSPSVINAVQLTVNITIAPDAQPGSCYVMAETGSERVLASDAFSVNSQYGSFYMNPQYGYGGETKYIVVYGTDTHFDDTTQFMFGNQGIDVESTTVLSPTLLIVKVNIAPDAYYYNNGFVVVSTGAETLYNGAAFNVYYPGWGSELAPDYGYAGETRDILFSTDDYDSPFDGNTRVFFDNPGITINSLTVIDPTRMLANITIAPTAPQGWCSVSYFDGTGNRLMNNWNGFVVRSNIIVSPSTGYPGVTGETVISGYKTHFGSTTQCIAGSPSIIPNSLKVITETQQIILDGSISANARPETFFMAVATDSEKLLNENAFTIYSLSVSPGYGIVGRTLDVTVYGNGTHFTGSSQVSFDDPAITVNSTTLISPTQLTVNITIGPAAALYQSNFVMVTTGSERVLQEDVFYIYDSYMYADPDYGYAGQTLNLLIYNQYGHFTDSSQVSFGTSAITVNSVKSVNSDQILANITITPAAAADYYTMTVTTGSEVFSEQYAFEVVGSEAATSFWLMPDYGHPGDTMNLVINGRNAGFTGASLVTFSNPGITVTSVKAITQTQQLIATIATAPSAALGNCSVTVATGSNTITMPDAFYIESGYIQGVEPDYGYPGETREITIVGTQTHFSSSGSMVSFPNSAITVTAITVTSATQLTARISIDADAEPGWNYLTVKTGSEESGYSFSIRPRLTISPENGWTGQSRYLFINGYNTHFDDTTQVSFSSPGILAGTPMIFSQTQLIVPVTISESTAAGWYDITVSTGAPSSSLHQPLLLQQYGDLSGGPEVITVPGTFSVQPLQVTPDYAYTGETLGLIIDGYGTHFADTSLIDFGSPSVSVVPGSVVAINAERLIARVTISSTAETRCYTVTVTSGSEIKTNADVFCVEAGSTTTTTTTPSTTPTTASSGGGGGGGGTVTTAPTTAPSVTTTVAPITTTVPVTTSSVKPTTTTTLPGTVTAGFSIDKQTGFAPLTVNFIDSSTPVGSIASWSWDFGDTASGSANTSTQQSPSHTYSTVGKYTVSLTVKGIDGTKTDTRTKNSYITVEKPPLAAEFTASPVSGQPPLAVTFTDNSTGEITSWSWDFGDTASGSANTSTQQNPSHTYTQAGTYTVTLNVTGPDGNKAIIKQGFITVSQTAPQADFTASPVSGTGSVSAQFTSTSKGTIASYRWSFGDGGTSTEQNPQHSYAGAGSYTVCLTVTGPDGLNSNTCRESYIKVNERLLLDAAVSGTVSGDAIAGVQVFLNGMEQQAVTDAQGKYQFNGVSPGSYLVTPLKEGMVFEPASKTVTVISFDVSGMDFKATALKPAILEAHASSDRIVADGKTPVTFVARVYHPLGAGYISSVKINLESIGGNKQQQMYDDGTNGDEAAGDGIYSFRTTVPEGTPPQQAGLIVTATDTKGLKDSKVISVTIVNELNGMAEGNSVYTYKLKNRLNGQTLVLRYQQSLGGGQASLGGAPIRAAAECSPYLEILRPDGTSFLKQRLPITQVLSEIEIKGAVTGEWTYRVTNECQDDKNFSLKTSSSGTALLSGMVVDATTGVGFAGIAVTTDGGGACSADESGFYTMIHPAGAFTIEASEEAHGTAVKSVTLDAGEMVEVDLALGGGGGEGGGCSATQALGKDSPKLNLLRAFRDSVLMKSDAGAQYVSLYYKHSPEVVALLKQDAGLQAEVKNCILNVLPVLSSMPGETQATFTEAQLREMTACLEKIKVKGSAALQKDLAGLIKQIGDRSVLRKLGGK